ncbi:MAG TPA: DUF5615 family PIN-like protein [Bryobacteraceae bacterium]
MKFLLDENLSTLHAQTVRTLGHDAVSVVEAGLSGADDSMVRSAAEQHGRISITLDADFANILRFPPAKYLASCVCAFTQQQKRLSTLMLRSCIPRLAGLDLRGKLVVVDSQKIRIRG